MKKEYDLKKLKKRPGKAKTSTSAAKVPISIRLDGAVLSEFKTEAERLGMPYQTFIEVFFIGTPMVSLWIRQLPKRSLNEHPE